MKIAVIGSRTIKITNLESYLQNADEIVSGGATGVDECAANFAQAHGIKLTVFLPDYRRYGRGAPIIRNRAIVEYADEVVAFWDGKSRGTHSVIKYSDQLGKPCRVIILEDIPLSDLK